MTKNYGEAESCVVLSSGTACPRSWEHQRQTFLTQHSCNSLYLNVSSSTVLHWSALFLHWPYSACVLFLITTLFHSVSYIVLLSLCRDNVIFFTPTHTCQNLLPTLSKKQRGQQDLGKRDFNSFTATRFSPARNIFVFVDKRATLVHGTSMLPSFIPGSQVVHTDP